MTLARFVKTSRAFPFARAADKIRPMSDPLFEGLNEAQASAVMHKDGPLMIVAGAGTGKTTVLTRRYAHLLSQEGISSENILALTFT